MKIIENIRQLKKYKFGLFAIIICLILWCGLGGDRSHKKIKNIKTYNPAPLTLILDWETTKPFNLQVFYTTEQNMKFNEKNSIKKQVTPKDKHIEIVLPTEKIYRFRLDFGSNPGKVKLKNVEIIADQYINFNDWLSYAYVNIKRHKIDKKNNCLKLFSSHRDPYIYWAYPFVLYKNEGQK